jgi:hypothetical protein
MINHNAMRAFVYVFQLLPSIVAPIFEATKIAASGPQRNRNVNKRTHCIVVDQAIETLPSDFEWFYVYISFFMCISQYVCRLQVAWLRHCIVIFPLYLRLSIFAKLHLNTLIRSLETPKIIQISAKRLDTKHPIAYLKLLIEYAVFKYWKYMNRF